MQAVLSELPPSAYPEPLGQLVWLPRIYITRPEHFRARSVRVVNLSRDCIYLGTGYYASLLAEARGHKVIPSVQTIIDLGRKSLYRFALPELDAVAGQAARAPARAAGRPIRLLIAFGTTEDSRFRALARAVFDRFRHPLLAVTIRPSPRRQPAHPLDPAAVAGRARRIPGCLVQQRARPLPQGGLARANPPSRCRATARHPLQHQDLLPPSKPATIKRLIRVGAQMNIEVELIGRQDFLRLGRVRRACSSARPRRSTNHTYRFARRPSGRAGRDRRSELDRALHQQGLSGRAADGARRADAEDRGPGPPTDIKAIGRPLGFPIVLKLPDGSFSRGVVKVDDRGRADGAARATARATRDLILAQEFMPTDFDWRVGVLDRQPLYACQYHMAAATGRSSTHGATATARAASRPCASTSAARGGRTPRVRRRA